MGALMRQIDWHNTPLDPVANWPASLRTMVTVVLGNRFPMCIWWGPELRHLYNDGYRPMLGAKHPASMGQPASEVWAEIWNVVGPMARQILSGGPATFSADLLLEMNRYGYVEETYFTFAYSPIPGTNCVGGVLITVQETTSQVLAERRLKTLRELAARSAEAKTAEDACTSAAEILAANPSDVPFALLYLSEPDGDRARLVSLAGLERHQGAGAPELVALDRDAADSWPLAEAERGGHSLELTDLADRFGRMPGGRWPEATQRAIVAPLRRSGQRRPYGFLVAGISPRLEVDHSYRGFFELAVDQIATAIANARAHQEERQRAEALAEIDRAKSVFFSNVSHELRTPLTLILGPLEDALGESSRALRGENLELAHRNALRLLKLVNALLDFSRIEAGRVQPSFEPTDLAALTGEIAGAFRVLAQRAGLSLAVECGKIEGPVYVDREMWEKIVLNLVSNAFKFTFAGVIRVDLREVGDRIQLTVRDTGTGIPEHELPRLFERFHRVEGAHARSGEGSGIGLALVSELVNIHGGEVAVASRVGEGTTFTVSIPTGTKHLDQRRIVSERPLISTASGAASFVEEAKRWVDGPAEFAEPGLTPSEVSPQGGFDESDRGARILLADDSADMRDYVKGLLAHHYVVETAIDGLEALRLARAHPPDLVLTDVMMPNLDGFGLLRELRADPKLKLIPIIVISARAGEESRVEGIERGADDYLVKPFSARELVARIHSHLALQRLRAQTEHERELLLQREQEARAAAEEANRAKDEFLAMLGHELRNPLSPILTSLNLMQMRGSDSFRRERDIIARQVHHLVQLVDDLLDVSRITRGKIQLKLEPIELITVVVKAIEMASPIIEQRMHHLIAVVPSVGLKLAADPTRLAQVICNLLTNAAKYTEPGGNIWIRAEREDGRIALRVRDNGMGILPAMLPRVFGLFSQGTRTLDRAQGGLGIGLTIVKSLVELHGGAVEAHSEGVGRGSEFVIRLPAVDDTVDADHGTVASAESGAIDRSMPRAKIFVVDDNQDAAEILAEALEESGYLTRVAFDAPSALEAVGAFNPDVMLIDIGLPVMDGYELARRLRANPQLASARLIAVTGYGQESDRRRALEAGFNEHLVKPIDLERLQEMLHMQLRD